MRKKIIVIGLLAAAVVGVEVWHYGDCMDKTRVANYRAQCYGSVLVLEGPDRPDYRVAFTPWLMVWVKPEYSLTKIVGYTGAGPGVWSASLVALGKLWGDVRPALMDNPLRRQSS